MRKRKGWRMKMEMETRVSERGLFVGSSGLAVGLVVGMYLFELGVRGGRGRGRGMWWRSRIVSRERARVGYGY